jgi:acyl-coenzyme A thioesterase PaaI-like protein
VPSYPPPHHLLRDLRPSSIWLNNDELRFIAPVVPEVRNRSGAMACGPMTAVTDLAAATVGVAGADGDWVGTVDLSLRRAAPLVDGPLVVTASVVRAGGRLINARCEIHDGHGTDEPGTLAGTATATLRRMRRDLALDENPPQQHEVGVRRDWARPESGFDQSLNDTVGLVEVSPGIVELSKSPYVTNSFGTINGGTTAILIAAGAESAVGGTLDATDIEVRYIGQAADGPVRTTSEVLRMGLGHAVVDVMVIDVSNGGMPIALASVTLTGDRG